MRVVLVDPDILAQVRLMLVLAPAACIMGGIALSEAFATFTLSIKYQVDFPEGMEPPPVKVK